MVRNRATSLLVVLGAALAHPTTGFAIAFNNGTPVGPNTIGVSGYEYLSGVGSLFTNDLSRPGFGFSCTGSLLASNLVLSAAHCFDGSTIDGTPAATRSTFSLFDNLGFAHSFAGTTLIHPGYVANATSTGLASIANDIALLVLDNPAPSVFETYPIIGGAADSAPVINQLNLLNATTVGFGRHFEEGTLVGAAGSGRFVGSNRIEGYTTDLCPTPGDRSACGRVFADLDFGAPPLDEGIPQPGDSGGPLLSFLSQDFLPGLGIPGVSMGGEWLGGFAIVGVSSFGRDTNRNQSYADLGDLAFWTYLGGYSNWILNEASKRSIDVDLARFQYNKFSDCPPGVICKVEVPPPPNSLEVPPGEVQFGPPRVGLVPEPSTPMLLIVLVASGIATGVIRRGNGYGLSR